MSGCSSQEWQLIGRLLPFTKGSFGSFSASCDGQKPADFVEKVGHGFHDRKVRA